MPPTKQPIDQRDAARTSLQLAFSVMGQIGALTLGIVMGVLIIGIVLDRVLGTKPLFTLLLFLASFPASMYIIYRVALRAVASAPAQPPASSPARVEEELTSDQNTTPSNRL
jgi:F0F1-type ATP synthase assembly protein I